jgi:hypothetical protein
MAASVLFCPCDAFPQQPASPTPYLTLQQTLLYQLQYRAFSGQRTHDGVVALLLSPGSAEGFAEFDDISGGGVCQVEFQYIPYDGACRISTCTGQPAPIPISAGQVKIQSPGPGPTIVMKPNPDNTYDVGFLSPGLPQGTNPEFWSAGETVTFVAQGDKEGFSSFREQLQVPTSGILTSPLLRPGGNMPIDRTQPLSLTWTSKPSQQQSLSTFTVSIGTLDGSSNAQCDFPLTTFQQGQIPASVLSTLPTTGRAFISADMRQERADFLSGTESVFVAATRFAQTPAGDDAFMFVTTK